PGAGTARGRAGGWQGLASSVVTPAQRTWRQDWRPHGLGMYSGSAPGARSTKVHFSAANTWSIVQPGSEGSHPSSLGTKMLVLVTGACGESSLLSEMAPQLPVHTASPPGARLMPAMLPVPLSRSSAYSQL